MRPHEIEKSAEIFSAQKIREVNYKQRRRKVDEERENQPKPSNNEVEIYDDPQPQEPKSEYDYNEDSENYQGMQYQYNDEQMSSSVNNKMYKEESGQSFNEKASNINTTNIMKGESTVNINDRSSNVLNSYVKNNLLFYKNEESSNVHKDYVVYGSGMKRDKTDKRESKKIPTKKISSDKKKRVVNVDKRKLSNSNGEGRPLSKTGNIYDLNAYRSNEKIQLKSTIKEEIENNVDESIIKKQTKDESENYGSSKHINYIKSITRANSNNTDDITPISSKFKLQDKVFKAKTDQVKITPSLGFEKTFFAKTGNIKKNEENKREESVTPKGNISINSPFKNVYENIAKMSRMQNNPEQFDRKRDGEDKTINTYSKISDNSERTYSRRNKVLNRRNK